MFDRRGAEPIGLSVEARRERDEQYDVGAGLFDKCEPIDVWATEEDQTVGRAVDRGQDLYRHPLSRSRKATVQLVERLAATSAALERGPRFYKTLTSNCTNELAKNANNLSPGAVPLSLAWLIPGAAVEQLCDLGYIPHDRPLPEVRRRHAISDLVRESHRDPTFSRALRSHLGAA